MKIYIDVVARFDTEGRIMPLRIQWEDGRTFEVDRVLSVCRAASLKAGGVGDRYTVRIMGHERYLWREENKWFVEG